MQPDEMHMASRLAMQQDIARALNTTWSGRTPCEGPLKTRPVNCNIIYLINWDLNQFSTILIWHFSIVAFDCDSLYNYENLILIS